MKVNSEILYELINNGTIKANTKIKVYDDDNYKTTITFDGYDFIWEIGKFTSGMLFNSLCDFEIIEEEKEIEEINIKQEKNIKNNWKWKIKDTEHDYNISTPQKIMCDKINELVRELNKIKKEGK